MLAARLLDWKPTIDRTRLQSSDLIARGPFSLVTRYEFGRQSHDLMAGMAWVLLPLYIKSKR